jgi:hypothetical protein
MDGVNVHVPAYSRRLIEYCDVDDVGVGSAASPVFTASTVTSGGWSSFDAGGGAGLVFFFFKPKTKPKTSAIMTIATTPYTHIGIFRGGGLLILL